VNHEPVVAISRKDASEEESDEDETGDSDDGKGGKSDDEEENSDEERKALPSLRFGPPKGSCSGQVKAVVSHDCLVEGDIPFLFCYFIYLLSYPFLDVDLSNLAPPERSVPANGSSCSAGGVLHGRALGNAPNIGDPFETMPQDIQPLPRGQINVMIVKQPPSDVIVENPTSHLKVMSPCYETLGPLLKNMAKSYSPVRSKYFII
jgi:hypothetical protein